MDEEDFWEELARSNLSEVEYLEAVLGPKYLPMKLVLPMTIIYVLIFMTGVFGNITTCMVIIKNSSMQNATNYYLFSLAISDLMLLILGLPNELSVFWQQYPWALGIGLCKLRAYVSEMSSYVSVMTIVAFSSERYMAICHPLSLNAMSGQRRLIKIIVGYWLIGCISALPFAIYTEVHCLEYPPGSGTFSADSAVCTMILPDFPIYELSCIIFFSIPMLIILILYVRMGLKIRNSIRLTSLEKGELRNSAHYDCKRVRSRRSIIRMLSAVVVMFFVCWAPFHAQRLLYVYGQSSDYYPDLSEWLYLLSGCLYYVSTTVNPILYNLMSTRYREAFKKTLLCRKTTSKTKQANTTLLYNKNFTNNVNNQRQNIRNSTDNLRRLLESKETHYDNTFEQDKLRIPVTKSSHNHHIAIQQISIESTSSKVTLVTESDSANNL